MNELANILGDVCKTLFPIPEEIYQGNELSDTAVCTLSDIKLLKKISQSELMNDISLAGRLLSENKGIDSIVRYVNSHKNLKKIIICGKDVTGHHAGSSLLALYNNGIDNNGRIINSTSPNPILNVSQNDVKKFQSQIKLINKIGISDFEKISKLIHSKKN